MHFPELPELPILAKRQAGENQQFLSWLSKKPAGQIDQWFHTLHRQAFDQYDCLSCANCCKSISPMISFMDVDRIAASLRIRPSDLVDRHLALDTDGTYIFRTQPCPFLGPDHYCFIYKSRPKACAGYPHTDRRRMNQLLSLTLRNIAICPIVFAIVNQMKSDLSWKK
jgi:Fe-S-cluster containining protein